MVSCRVVLNEPCGLGKRLFTIECRCNVDELVKIVGKEVEDVVRELVVKRSAASGLFAMGLTSCLPRCSAFVQSWIDSLLCYDEYARRDIESARKMFDEVLDLKHRLEDLLRSAIASAFVKLSVVEDERYIFLQVVKVTRDEVVFTVQPCRDHAWICVDANPSVVAREIEKKFLQG